MKDWGLVLLAGGGGKRIGGNKPDVRFRGQRLIDIAQNFAQAFNGQKVISVRQSGQVKGSEFPEILDEGEDRGPISGLLSAFGWARSNSLVGIVTMPCDAPFLPSDLFLRLIEVSEQKKKPAVAASNGRLHPVCGAWPISCSDQVVSYANEGRCSLHGALEACEGASVEWPATQLDPFTNINTPEDLERFE